MSKFDKYSKKSLRTTPNVVLDAKLTIHCADNSISDDELMDMYEEHLALVRYNSKKDMEMAHLKV